jgi:hypothetical protein
MSTPFVVGGDARDGEAASSPTPAAPLSAYRETVEGV